jgi:hypothetical protein
MKVAKWLVFHRVFGECAQHIIQWLLYTAYLFWAITCGNSQKLRNDDFFATSICNCWLVWICPQSRHVAKVANCSRASKQLFSLLPKIHIVIYHIILLYWNSRNRLIRIQSVIYPKLNVLDWLLKWVSAQELTTGFFWENLFIYPSWNMKISKRW